MVLAKLWTWIGQIFTPLAIAWAVFVRGGLSTDRVQEGVLISRGYWGLLVTLIAAASLTWVAALYVREAKRTGSVLSPPPNTMFEDRDARNSVVSWATVVVFSLTTLAALVLFSARYADSRIHEWGKKAALASGFFSSRLSAHDLGCAHGPCFAVGQRTQDSASLHGVNEYILFVTDGALAMGAVVLLGGLGFLVASIMKKAAAPKYEL